MFLFFVFMDQETAFSKSIMDIVKKTRNFLIPLHVSWAVSKQV